MNDRRSIIFRWILISVLVATGLFACRLTWRARVQRNAVYEIRKVSPSSTVIYEGQGYVVVGSIISIEDRSRRGRFEKFIGVDYFHNVIGLMLDPSEVDRTAKAPLKVTDSISRLHQLQNLVMSPPFCDDDLIKISGLEKLQVLNLSDRKRSLRYGSLAYPEKITNDDRPFADSVVTDAGLAQIGRLTNLTALNLGSRNSLDSPHKMFAIRGEGLAHLSGLTKLTHLVIDSAVLNGEGLRQIGALTNLRTLHIRSGAFNESDLKHLTGLTNLETISFTDAPIGILGLSPLKQLPNLYSISLDDRIVWSDQAKPKNMQGLPLFAY
jgi:hypothetical protein